MMCNNYSIQADTLANKWEALVIKKGGKLACSEENLGILEIQVARPPSMRPLSPAARGVACQAPTAACVRGRAFFESRRRR